VFSFYRNVDICLKVGKYKFQHKNSHFSSEKRH